MMLEQQKVMMAKIDEFRGEVNDRFELMEVKLEEKSSVAGKKERIPRDLTASFNDCIL